MATGHRSARGNWHNRLRIGIMGGTFDPIHNGHLVAASEVSWVYDLDEVIFVPTGRPVFKLDKKVTNAEDRYLMTVIATASNPKFTVSRVDIDRPGVTYTIDTLRDIRAQHPDAELFFITGADAVAEIMPLPWLLAPAGADRSDMRRSVSPWVTATISAGSADSTDFSD